MFSSVSWTEYVMVLGVGIFAWYVGTLLILYRKNIIKIINGRRQPDTAYEVEEPEVLDAVVAEKDERPVDPLQTTQIIIGEIKKVFAGSKAETPSVEILNSLRAILSKYPQLKYSEFKQAIGELIQSNASRMGRTPFSPEELETIWNF